MTKDDQRLTNEFLIKHYKFDENKKMYIIHKSDDVRLPNFYCCVGNGLYVEKGSDFFLLSYEIDNLGMLKKFSELFNIPVEF